MALDSPLEDIIRTVGLTDTEIRRMMRDAAAEADRVIRSYGDSLSDARRLRAAQLELAKQQALLWGGVADATKVGIGDAFDASALWQARWDVDLMRSVGLSGTHWHQSLLATARAGIDAFVARQENMMTLSQRVYRNQALSRGYVNRTINNGLLLGKSVTEIAADVKKYIDPRTPGGASYAAMRLARTEVVTAYHESSKKQFMQTPWVERVRWNLSGSHPRPDTCNEYAEDVQHRGWPAGVYRPGDVPDKPHPNCLCYITPEVMDLDQYAKNFKQGKYDKYIDEQMGCTRVA